MKSIFAIVAVVVGVMGCGLNKTPDINPGPVHFVGQTVASLGNPTVEGMWLRTTLVQSETVGTVRDVQTGKSVNVVLHPMAGRRDAGAQASRMALMALEVALVDLPTIDVFAAD